MTPELSLALSSADRALARLDGATLNLPNPNLFVYGFMRQEAVLSSQIEGTQASLQDVLEYEARGDSIGKTDDLTDVLNYLTAMRWGLEELKEIPVCLRLIKGLHARLLAEGRGSDRSPGEFRNDQNWIGAPGYAIEEATYVPPAVTVMQEALNQWERFLHEEKRLPPLIKCALVHAQFETIHPFWDGNGRLGRMIVTFLLCSERILAQPLLYLSLFFKKHREDYYALLQATRDDGNWEDWIIFFLRGVSVTSKIALQAAYEITKLRDRLLKDAHGNMRSRKASLLADKLFESPYLTVPKVTTMIDASYPTANSVVDEYQDAGYLDQVGSGQRDRVFAFTPYLDILHETADDLTGVISGEDYLITNAS